MLSTADREIRPLRGRRRARFGALALMIGLAVAIVLASAEPAHAQDVPVPTPVVPEIPVPGDSNNPDPLSDDDPALSIEIGGSGENAPSNSVLLIVGLSVLSLAPSLVMMLSSFTRMIIVFSLTRNALGLQNVPPNQVLVGLALFLSLFVMMPTISAVNEEALQPYLDGTLTQDEALAAAAEPVRAFMLEHTSPAEMELMLEASGEPMPDTVDDISLTTLIPAFMLSEMKSAFIIGFVIFIPFLVIDIVVAAALMALGMMMLPPVFVSLPFKLLLFIMVGGWSLIAETLLASFVV
ncbi:MAG: flagellar type III secretion system pore protein FliP [Actinomycetota bacterium]